METKRLRRRAEPNRFEPSAQLQEHLQRRAASSAAAEGKPDGRRSEHRARTRTFLCVWSGDDLVCDKPEHFLAVLKQHEEERESCIDVSSPYLPPSSYRCRIFACPRTACIEPGGIETRDEDKVNEIVLQPTKRPRIQRYCLQNY